MNFLKDFNRIGFSDIAIHEKYGWFCNLFFSALFRMDLTTLELEFVTMLPAKNPLGYMQYGSIRFFENKLIIVPINSDRIIIYDLSTQNITEINIDLYADTSLSQLFKNSVIFEGNMFVFPGKSRAILKLNLTTFEIESIGDWYNEIEADIVEDRIIFSDMHVGVDGTVILSCWQSNKILIFDMQFCTYEIREIKGLKQLSACNRVGETLLLTERDYGTLAFVTDNTVNILELDLPNYITEKGIRAIRVHDHFAYLFPYYANMILKVDLNAKEIFCAKELLMQYIVEENPNVGLDNMRCCQEISDDYIIYYSIFDGKIVKYNLENDETIEKDSLLKENSSRILSMELMRIYLENVIHEDQSIGASELIEYLKVIQETECKSKDINLIGEKLYYTMK